jgi:hypothetical protein
MRSLATLAAVTLLSVPALGGGLESKNVSREARLLVHFDVDALLRSDTWRLVSARASESGAIELDGLQEIERELGIDPLKDLRSITVYGFGGDEEHTVILATVGPAIETALARLGMQESYRRETRDGRELHSWKVDGESVTGWLAPAAENGDRVVALSPDVATLLRGIDVLQGTAPSLAGARDAAVHTSPRLGSIVYVSAADLPKDLDLDEASKVLDMAQSVTLDLGESGGLFFAKVALTVTSEDEALDVIDVLEGLRALALLATRGQDNEEIALGLSHIVRAVRLDVRGSDVLIDFEYRADQLIEDLAALANH